MLSGVGIAQKQCTLNYNEDDRRTVIIPNTEDTKKYKVMVNGELIVEPTDIQHGDRILIGSHHYFLFVDPLVDADEQVDYEAAMKEANKEQMSLFEQDESYNKKLKEMEQKIRQDQEAKANLL